MQLPSSKTLCTWRFWLIKKLCKHWWGVDVGTGGSMHVKLGFAIRKFLSYKPVIDMWAIGYLWHVISAQCLGFLPVVTTDSVSVAVIACAVQKLVSLRHAVLFTPGLGIPKHFTSRHSGHVPQCSPQRPWTGPLLHLGWSDSRTYLQRTCFHLHMSIGVCNQRHFPWTGFCLAVQTDS